jgi:FMN reductase
MVVLERQARRPEPLDRRPQAITDLRFWLWRGSMALTVVGIGGTTRDNSSSERALRTALAAAEKYGAETELFAADALDLPMYMPDAAVRSDKARHLVKALARCDAVIITGPSGLVKNALDYVEDLREDARPYFHGRAVGCIVCASGWQATTTTLVALRSIVHALRGWPTPLGVCINTTAPTPEADEQLAIRGEQVVSMAQTFGAAAAIARSA